MTKIKAAFTLAMLSSMVACGSLATNASAATTLYKCQSTNQMADVQFADAHCLAPTAQDGTGYKHVAVTEEISVTTSNVQTAAGTSASEDSTLESTAAGIATAITCTTVAGAGKMKNSESGGEMIASGTSTIEYSGCTVTKPAGKGCLVKGGKVTTNSLSLTSKEQGAAFNITPTSGTEIASITIEGCSVAGLNKTFPLTGSVKVTPNGATVTTTHAAVTAANTLKFAGQKAGLSGSYTQCHIWGLFCDEAIVET